MIFSDRTTRSSRLLLALPIAALAFSLAACSGASRPTSDDVATGIQQVFEEQGQGDLATDEVASCLADALVDSELSNETLTYIANGEDKQKDEADKDLTTKIIQENVETCMAG